MVGEQEKCTNPEPIRETKTFKTSPAHKSDLQNIHNAEGASQMIAVSNQFSGDLQALDEKVKSMMEKGQNLVQDGKQANGTPKHEKAFICKVCGKEGKGTNIVNHIEANHLEGISIPCDYCGKVFGARRHLRDHKAKYHK